MPELEIRTGYGMAEVHEARRSVIRTPDQRLRVFVSSTLQELAEERAAARRAVERLRLSPVMFELGARPHPPRDLYRAYLEQSHVFVGIYWQRYGWVAPGETISGLEDEFNLSGDRQKLIYVKSPAPDREDRLKALLDRVRDEDHTSYRPFHDAAELEAILADDLALLLTESFESTNAAPEESAVVPPLRSNLPVPPTPLVGREAEVARVRELLAEDRVRLVTLLGPGGIGKTRLAIAVASGLEGAFPDGIAFVPLAGVRDPMQVPAAIASALGVREVDGQPLLEGIKRAIDGRRMLLILDNFEQVLEAAAQIADLLAACPGLEVLATSRAALRVSAEFECVVPPLPVPEAEALKKPEELEKVDAVRLFVERARAMRPDFRLSEDNAADVAAITARLDGLPLAIELAAAQVRVLPPRAILERLHNRLRLLTGGPRDLPDRQRTLRNTIEWSYQLLPEDQRRLFAWLAAFSGGATLEAIEAVCDDGNGILEGLQALVDGSLVRVLDGESAEPRYAMLETIREYALERLEESGEADALRERHAEHYVCYAEQAAPFLRGHAEDYWFDRLEREGGNLRSLVSHSLAKKEASRIARLGWAIWDFWWVRGHQNEGRAWGEAGLELASSLSRLELARLYFVTAAMALIQGDFERMRQCGAASLPLAQAEGDEALVALLGFAPSITALYAGDGATARATLEGALAAFRRLGNRWGVGHTLQYLWLASAVEGRGVADLRLLEESNATFHEIGEKSGLILGLRYQALAVLSAGEVPKALTLLEEGISLAQEIGNRWYLGYCLEATGSVATAVGDLERAARLFGAGEALRDEVNAPATPADLLMHAASLAALRAGLGDPAFELRWAEGRTLGQQRAVAEAFSLMRSPAASARAA
jgi:predicted ATPase